ncbi:hypothetical protein [Arthrobacter sp.]|uniref:hypothetical protein n=1 Tax=Arthrobacter sp. TaxID=1667 RepID=UPI003396E0FE
MVELSWLRQIVAALHIDPRASWRTIATVLREPERTVARNGRSVRRSRSPIRRFSASILP